MTSTATTRSRQRQEEAELPRLVAVQARRRRRARRIVLVSFVTVMPVLFLGLVGYRSLGALLVGGFFLGIAGTSFAVGVPFVNAGGLIALSVVAAITLAFTFIGATRVSVRKA